MNHSLHALRFNRRVLLAVIMGLSTYVACADSSSPERGDGREPIDSVSSALAPVSPNLIANPSVETVNPSKTTEPLNWKNGGFGTNTVVFSYDATTSHTGSRSVKIDMTAYTSGDAKWFFDAVPVTPGVRYVFRDYYKSTANSRVVAAITVPGTGTVFQTLVNAVPASPTDFSTVAASLTPPAGATAVTVYHLIQTVGTLWVDDARLALPQGPDLDSGVPNGSLEQPADLDLNQPLAWQASSFGTNSPVFAYAATGHGGDHSITLAVSSYTDGDAKWFFDPQPATALTRYHYSDWYISDVPSFITARATLTDGTFKYIVLGSVPASAEYAQAHVAFLTPVGTTAVTVFHGLNRVGNLQFDDAALEQLPPAELVNGVPNGNLDQEAYPGALERAAWYRNSFGNHDAALSVVVDEGGNHNLRIDITNYTDGAASWFFDAQPVDPSKAYLVTDHYRSNVDTTLVALVTLADGTTRNVQLPVAFASEQWTDYSAKMYLPEFSVSVVIYHRLTAVGYLETDDFGMVQTITAPFDRPLVSLTFDDAWRTDYTNVLPVLQAHHVPATNYILTGSLGEDDRLTLEMIDELQAAGNEIGAHTVTHSDLTKQTPEEVESELTDSLALLEGAGFLDVVNFASPYGAYNAPVLATIETLYGSHRTVEVGYNSKDDFDRYRLKVQNIRNTTTVGEVDAWAARAAADGTWLILVYHDVEDPPAGIYGTTPTNLDAQIAAIQSHGLAIVTVEQALDELTPQTICDDHQICTTDSGDPVNGCIFTPNSLSCDDSNACTLGDVCADGTCQAGTTAPVCTPYVCDPALGCKASCTTAADCGEGLFCDAGSCVASCDDNNPCTNDTVDSGMCVHGALPNGNDCTGADKCAPSSCQAGMCVPSAPITCAAQDQCHAAGTCNPATGACSNPAAANGTSCSDGNLCTTTDSCQAGVCTSGTPVTCTALDQCHSAGVCAPTTGVCSNPIRTNGTSCNDGNLCTPTDSCQAGVCTAGAAITCAALDQCHSAGTCAPATGVCSNPNRANNTTCNDNSACTTTDRCQSGVCTGTAVNCADTNACTADTCNPTTGACSHPAGNAGTVCRTASNVCDSAETCTGTSTSCPSARDTLAPTLSAGTDQTLMGTCSSTAITYTKPTASNSASGQCDNPPQVTCTSIAGNSYGAHVVSCTARDSTGNVSSPVTFNVTLLQPLTVRIQSPLREPNTNNIARVGWTVTHNVKLFNCANQDVTATAAVTARLTTSSKTGFPSGTFRLSSSNAAGDTGGVMRLVGAGAAATYEYRLSTTGMAVTGLGTSLDSRYLESLIRVTYNSAPTLTAGQDPIRLSITN